MESKNSHRWLILFLAAFAMGIAYFYMEMYSPLKAVFESDLHWSIEEWGFFLSSYSWLNIFLFFLLIGGVLSDLLGTKNAVRIASVLMIIGALTEFIALKTGSHELTVKFFGYSVSPQVLFASIGYAIFGTGIEMAGINVVKMIAKAFNNHVLTTAYAIETIICRIASLYAITVSPHFLDITSIQGIVLFGVILMVFVFLLFILAVKVDCKIVESKQTSKKTDWQLLGKSLPAVIVLLIIASIVYAAFFPVFSYGSILITDRLDIAPFVAYKFISFMPLGMMVISSVFAVLHDFFGKGVLIIVIGSIFLVSGHLILWFSFSLPTGLLYFGFGAILFGFSMVASVIWVLLIKSIPARFLGTGLGLAYYIQNVLLFIIPVILGAVYTKSGNEIIGISKVWGIFILISSLVVVFSIVLLILNKTKGYTLNLANYHWK